MARAETSSYIDSHHSDPFSGVELLKLPSSTVVDPASVALFCQGPYWFKLLVSDAQFVALSRGKAVIQDQTGCALAFSAGTCMVLENSYHALMVASSSLDSLCTLCRDIVENFLFPASEEDGILICLGSDAALCAALDAGGSAICPRAPIAVENDEYIIRVSSKACAGLPSVLGIVCKEVINAIQADKAGMMKIMEIEYSSPRIAQSPYAPTAVVPSAHCEQLPSIEVSKISISFPLKEAEANEIILAEVAMRRISHETETFIQLKRPHHNDMDKAEMDVGGYVMTITGTLNGLHSAHRKIVAILVRALLKEEAETTIRSATSTDFLAKEQEPTVVVGDKSYSSTSTTITTPYGTDMLFKST